VILAEIGADSPPARPILSGRCDSAASRRVAFDDELVDIRGVERIHRLQREVLKDEQVDPYQLAQLAVVALVQLAGGRQARPREARVILSTGSVRILLTEGARGGEPSPACDIRARVECAGALSPSGPVSDCPRGQIAAGWHRAAQRQRLDAGPGPSGSRP
jgi:hypothetical protein